MRKYPGLVKIFSTLDHLMSMHVANLLKTKGFNAEVKNLHLADYALPRIIAEYEVWVEEENYVEAKKVLDRAFSNLKSVKPSWVCRDCKENIEGQFTECWSCGSSKVSQKITNV